jgi:hypothetical protein
MKNPLDPDSQPSGLLLGSDPLEDVRNRRAAAQSDDDKTDSKDSDGMDGDSDDDDSTDAADSDATDSDATDNKD